MLTPGLVYLLHNLLKLLVQFSFVAAITYGASALSGFQIDLPLYLKGLVCLGVLASVLIGRALWSGLRQRLDARARGAVFPPVVKGKLPGNIDTIHVALEHERTGYLGDDILEYMRPYGRIFSWPVLWEDKIFTFEPEHIKMVLATEFNNFEKGPVFKEHAQSVLGDGVFNSDGEMWKFHRSMTRPFFSKDRISHFDIFARHADEAMASLKERLHEGHAIDMQDLFSRFTLDSATEYLFGRCVHVLRAGLPYSPNLVNYSAPETDEKTDAATRFSESFANAQVTLARRLRIGSIWPLFEIWEDDTKEDMKIVNSFIDPIMEDAVAKRKISSGDKKEVGEGETLLDHLTSYTSDTKILRDEILNIMIAGRDTTAATLTFATYCLARHPGVLNRLREEILAVVGKDRNPTYDDMKAMKYLRAFINEVLRLYPPVPVDERASINATTFPNKTPGAKPWYVPAHTRIIYSVFLMHTRTDLWGPDANEFDPDRFLDERLHKYLAPNPFIFLPFNAGPRICLGQQFAYNEASFMLVRLLQAFDAVELAPDAQPSGTSPPEAWAHARGTRKSVDKVWPKSHLTVFVNGGLWVRLHEAPLTESA